MNLFRQTITLLALLALALPAVAAADTTVGVFVQRLAQSKKLDATDARIAADTLRQAGVHLPVDLELSARLTEGDVARISRALGLAVSTNRPDAGFSGEQVDRFFESFRVELTLAAGGEAANGSPGRMAGTPFNPYTKGKGGSKGKKRGHPITPTEPE